MKEKTEFAGPLTAVPVDFHFCFLAKWEFLHPEALGASDRLEQMAGRVEAAAPSLVLLFPKTHGWEDGKTSLVRRIAGYLGKLQNMWPNRIRHIK